MKLEHIETDKKSSLFVYKQLIKQYRYITVPGKLKPVNIDHKREYKEMAFVKT